MIIFN